MVDADTEIVETPNTAETEIVPAPAAAAVGEVVTPLEQDIVDDMRRIVRGNVVVVPRFVHHLVRYFEEGSRPGMSPVEISQHLGAKAAFVMHSLFRLPEVGGEALGHRHQPAPRLAAEGGGDTSDEGSETATVEPPTVAAVAPTNPPRWYDVFIGICVGTRMWKFSVATGIVNALGLEERRRATVATLVALACAHRTVPSLGTVFADLLFAFVAFDVHSKQYATSACAAAATCVSIGAIL